MRRPSPLHVFLPLLLVVSIARLWVMPMFSSFWVDEMGTVFVVRQGAGHPSLAVAPQVPQSVYYALPRVSTELFGFSEFAWRLPSLLAMLAALALVARLSARLVHPHAAWFAVFACLALRGIDYQAADARPYALGTLVASAALWFLVRWLDAARWRDAAGCWLCAALLWRVQLVFWPMYLLFAAYAMVRLARGESRASWRGVGIVFALLAVALLPVLLDALRLYRQAAAHVVVALPSLRDLADSLKPGLVAVCGAGAWLVSRVFRWPAQAEPLPRSSLALILGWWFCQPLCLFAFSHLTGASVFVSRYLWLSLPGAVLAATAAASRFIPAKRWQAAAAALAIGVVLLNAQWNRPWPLHHNSDWRAAAAVRALSAPDTPVICPSPFIEARPPVWTPGYRLPGFLYAHLSVYPVSGQIHLFPFEPSPEAAAYAQHIARDILPAAGLLVVYGGAGQAGYWREWFAKRPELEGWRATRLGPFADVEVFAFQR